MGKDSKSPVQVLMGTPAKGSRSPWGSSVLQNVLLLREQGDPDPACLWRSRPQHGGKGREGDGPEPGRGRGPFAPELPGSVPAAWCPLLFHSCQGHFRVTAALFRFVSLSAPWSSWPGGEVGVRYLIRIHYTQAPLSRCSSCLFVCPETLAFIGLLTVCQ